MTADLTTLFERDLLRLRQEIEAFSDENDLWRTTGKVPNPAGNLCLHLVGNLKTYIGKNLGHFPFVRDREAEFKRRGVARQELLHQIEETRLVVRETLRNLDPNRLSESYPEPVFDYPMTTGYFLLHLTAHLSYHLGQINYLRRALA